MAVLVVLLALALLVMAAYRGLKGILFAPAAVLLAALLTDPSHVLPFFSGVFLDRMATFLKLYFHYSCSDRRSVS